MFRSDEMDPVTELVSNKDLKEEAFQRIKEAVERITSEVKIGSENARARGALFAKTGETQKIIGAAEKMDTPNDKSQNNPNVSMHPIFSLKQTGAPPRAAMIGGAAAVLLVIIALSVLFFRETSLRKQALSALAQAEQARAKLEASFTQLRTEMTTQKDELVQLASDLRAAGERAEQADKLRAQSDSELAKVKKFYEGQMADLKKTLREREGIITSLEANLKSVRALLEGKGGAIDSMTLVGPGGISASGISSANQVTVKAYKPVPGKVLMVDQRNRFIVVNLGPADGAQPGQFLRVYQGKSPLGEARIDRIYQNLSAATIISEDTIQRVRKGDTAYLTLS